MTAAFVVVRRFVAAALLRGALAVALVGGSFLVGAGNFASAQQTPDCCRSTGPGAVTAADNGSTNSDGRIKATYTRFQYQAGPFGGANWVEGNVRRTDGGNVLVNGNANSKALSRNTQGNATQGGEIVASGLVVPQEYIAAVWANYPGGTGGGGNGFVVRDVAIIYFGTIPTPATPVSLAVSVFPQRVSLNWNRVTYAERLSVVVATHDHAVTVTNIANGALSGNNIAPTRRSHVVSGLSDDRTYTVRARSVGPGGASGEALATITTPMGIQAPTDLSLSVAVTPDRIANPKATLSWTVQANGTAITAFILTYRTTTIALPGSASGRTIDLAFNTSYAFTLQALNAGGTIQVAAAAVSVASGVPYQPAKPGASATPNGASPAQVTVSWVAPADGGSTITAYRIQHYTKHHTALGNADYNRVTFTVAASQTMSVFSVNFGVSNIFYVAAINSHGAGIDHFSNNILIAAAPVAPTLTVAPTSPGVVPAQVTLSWGAPNSNGSAITAYILSGSESATLPASASQTVISISLGVQYHFTLLAANAVGNSPADSAAVSVAALAPGAPAVVASPTPHGVTPERLTISMSVSNNGGSPVTHFRVRYSSYNISVAATDGQATYTITDTEIFYFDTTFNFSVAAINAIGTSAYTAGSALATSTPPFAATDFAAATTPAGEAPAKATLSWTPPASGGKAISGYIFSYGTVSANLPASARNTVVDISLLVGYAFTLRAQNEKGAGAPAAVSVSVAALLPGAPSVRIFTTPHGVQPQILTINWSAPAADGGSPITSYVIRHGIDVQYRAPSVSAYIITDTDVFALDTDFVFRVGAINAVGTTYITATALVTSTAPFAPQNFDINPAPGGTISLSWTAEQYAYSPGSGGKVITAYILTYRNVSTNFANNISNVVITASVNQPYGFTLRAANEKGVGPAAEIPVFTVGQEPPARPVSLGLWIDPAADGKLTLSGQDAALQWHVAPNTPSVSVYIVSFNGNSPATVAFVSATIQQHNLGANSIARGETVAFSVLARNQHGSSPSPAVLLVTVESTNPATVRNLAVNANVARVVATWSAPAHWGGGLPASANRYAYGFVGGVSGNVPNNDTVLTLTQIVAGEAIAANTGYTISIYATNAEGKSGMAVAVTFSTPQSPDAPGGVVAMGGNGRIAFSWSAPANLYGQPFSHYEYALLNASNATLTMGSVNAATATVGGGTLVNGDNYVFIVRAHSETDYGDYATLTAAPIAPPTAPALVGTVSDAANNTYIMGGGFSWTIDSAVSNYVVRHRGVDTTLAAGVNSHAIAQHTNGEAYSFTLLAYNAGLDPSAATITLTPFSRPGAPHNFAIAADPATPSSVTLSWSAPGDDGGFNIAHYSVTAGDFSADNIDANARQVVITGVSLGAHVTASVFAFSGPVSANVFAQGMAGVYAFTGGMFPPVAPTLAAAKGSKLATLTWNAPYDQGSAITAYIVYVNNTAVHTITAQATAYTHTVTGLSNGTEYTFGVAAVNGVDKSAQGVATATPQGVPLAPAGFNAVAGNGRATLTWQAADDQGDTITAYIVYIDNVAVTALAAGARGYTATALAIGTPYSFAVAAANSLGEGAKASDNAETPNTPTAPANLRADAGNATVSLFWNAANGRGSAITEYIVYVNATAVYTITEQAAAYAYAATGLTNGTVYMFGVAAVNAVGTGATAQVSATPEATTEEEKVQEVDKAIAPAVVAAVTRQQTKALNNRIGALISGINVGGGGAGGGNVGGNVGGGSSSSFSMLGATFNNNNLAGGIAQALKQHGGALANGENLDQSVLRSGSFALNAGEGNGAGGGGAFGIWGGADYAKIKDDEGNDTLDGHNASFFGGVDTSIASNVVVGLMFFHNRLKTDFASRNARGGQTNGEYRLQANGVNPYILWRGANASAWGGFGVGKGERTQEQPQEGINRTDDVSMYSGVFGFRFALLRQDNGFALDTQTDLSRAHTDIAGTKFKSLNLRAMLEARRDIPVIGGGNFSPFVQAALLRQKDDNENVEGWEAAAGARWNKGASWSGELRGRIARLSNGNQEVGGSGLLRHNASGNKGLMLSLQPTYGDAGEFSGGENILTQTTQSAAAKPAAQLRAHVGYGITGANAHWQPYIGATAGNNAEYRAGVSWQNALLRNSNMRAAIEAKREKEKTGLRFGFSANF